MEIPDHPFAVYWYALGKFVHRYAEIELTLHQVLRIVSGLNEQTAKVIFSGARVGGTKDMIKRFYTARKKPLPDELARAFERIDSLTKARDRLLHNGIQFERGKAIVTDESKNMAERAFKHTVSTADLDDLEADAITVNACLNIFWIRERRPDLLNAPTHQGWAELARSPWRYKQPKPMRPRSRIRSAVRERKPPRGS